MAKFCGNCGAQLDEGARVCGQCGMPVDGMPAGTPKLNIQDPEKQKKTQKTVRLAALLVGLLVVAVLLINLVPRYTGYRGLLRRVMAAYEDYDVDALTDLASELYDMYDDDGAGDYFEYTVGSALDYFEEAVGHDYALSYKIEEIYDLSERKLDSLRDELELSYSDFDADEIRRVVVAEITLTAKEGKRSSQRHVQLSMVKESDGWKVLFLQ